MHAWVFIIQRVLYQLFHCDPCFLNLSLIAVRYLCLTIPPALFLAPSQLADKITPDHQQPLTREGSIKPRSQAFPKPSATTRASALKYQATPTTLMATDRLRDMTEEAQAGLTHTPSLSEERGVASETTPTAAPEEDSVEIENTPSESQKLGSPRFMEDVPHSNAECSPYRESSMDIGLDSGNPPQSNDALKGSVTHIETSEIVASSLSGVVSQVHTHVCVTQVFNENDSKTSETLSDSSQARTSASEEPGNVTLETVGGGISSPDFLQTCTAQTSDSSLHEGPVLPICEGPACLDTSIKGTSAPSSAGTDSCEAPAHLYSSEPESAGVSVKGETVALQDGKENVR